MTYYKLIISLFITSLGQGAFAASADKDPLGFLDNLDFLYRIVPGCIVHTEDLNFSPLELPVQTDPSNSSNMAFFSKYHKADDDIDPHNAASSKRRKADASVAPASVSSASDLPLVGAILRYKTKQGSSIRLSKWLTDPSKSTRLDMALKALAKGKSHPEVIHSFGVPESTLYSYFRLLKKIPEDLFIGVTKEFLLKKTARGSGVATWEANFKLLECFIQKHGHARISQGLPLGQWVKRQRKGYRNKKIRDAGGTPRDRVRITQWQIAKLEALPGFKWNPPKGKIGKKPNFSS